jgi:hypothetical protein
MGRTSLGLRKPGTATSRSHPVRAAVQFCSDQADKTGYDFGSTAGRTWFGVRTVSPRKDQSCRVEPFSLTASAIVGIMCIATISTDAFAYRRGVGVGRVGVYHGGVYRGALTVVQPYAVEWRWATELLRSVLVPLELRELIAADTIRMDRASRALVRALGDRRACPQTGPVFPCRNGLRASIAARASATPVAQSASYSHLSKAASVGGLFSVPSPFVSPMRSRRTFRVTV